MAEVFKEKTLRDAEFCKSGCSMCIKARNRGKGFLLVLMKVTARFCPKCKAYQKVYRVPAWENPPSS